jgi:hypothetical protein
MVARIVPAALIAAFFLFPAGAIAAAPEGEGRKDDPNPAPYRAVASRATPGTPKIDGRLDDAVWALAQPITDFTQRDPSEGEPATERTVAWVLYDDDALFVGIRAYDSEPGEIVGQLTRRDTWSPSDWLAVSIDSYYDRRTAFTFRVNPAGVEQDWLWFDDTEQDESWNAVWDVATSVDAEGWVAEFRIPFSQLRFSAAPEQLWGFNLTREIARKNEVDLWKPIAKDASGWVSEFGDLAGIQGINPGRRLEILPYVMAQQQFAPAQAGNPFETGSDQYGTVGADLRYGLTNSLMLNLTVNPDFGQVEADPSVLNLSTFETRFEEKRPFFVEGASLFNFSLTGFNDGFEQLFYSRRIGRAPQGWADPQGGYVDYPMAATILGAGKLSGKSANGWTLGVLEAVTAEETAAVVDGEGVHHEEVVEPLTNYGVFRISREFDSGQSAVGGIVTAVNRRLPASMPYLRSAAYGGGLDARARFWGGNWEVTGKLMGSYVRGSRLAMELTQTSSARYFQRPDADHVELDTTRTDLAGSAGAFSFGKIGGGQWRGVLLGEWVSPGFEVNDLGFQRQADVARGALWVGYREFEPGKIFRSYNLNFNFWDMMTFGAERTATGGNVNGSFTLLNYWGGFGGFNYEFPALFVRSLRGGPAMKGPASWNAWGGFFSDERKPVSAEVGGYLWADVEASYSRGVYAFVNWRPRANLRLAIGPEYDVSYDDWYYVTTEDALGSAHYLMGGMRSESLSLTTRLDWTFTPNLSLQVYAQPFIAAGEQSSFDEIVAPKADAYRDRFDPLGPDRLSYEPSSDPGLPGIYYVDLDRDGSSDISFADPNFSIKELRSTLVLRWEYMPGSTLFFVWSQNRSLFDFTGGFDPAGDLSDLFAADGENILSIKVNYYLNP